MGHCATLKSKDGIKIMNVNFSMLDFSAHVFYALMNATDCNGVVSGNGIDKNYSLDELNEIKNKIQNIPDEKKVHGFIEWKQLEYKGESLIDAEVKTELREISLSDKELSYDGDIIDFVNAAIKIAEIDGNITIYYW
ncbi:MAG: hypothetical protein IT215_03355 [Chitinophagaceae bacterium]|nr:hypothetical protein [Chitinophagaceae bacterium]